MNFTEPHEPAFPTPGGAAFAGMTLRDWFAAMAMQALIGRGEPASEDGISMKAYFYADAMCARRDTRQPFNDDTSPIAVE